MDGFIKAAPRSIRRKQQERYTSLRRLEQRSTILNSYIIACKTDIDSDIRYLPIFARQTDNRLPSCF